MSFEQISQDFIDLKKSNLLYLYHSLNQPQISPGAGLSPEQAECYTFVVQDLRLQLSIFIGLFFPVSQKRVLYKLGPFNAEVLNTEMSETESFSSQMGFLMTNMQFGSASPDEKKEMLRTCPFFYVNVESYYQSLSVSEIEVKRSTAESGARKEADADQQAHFYDQYVTILSML